MASRFLAYDITFLVIFAAFLFVFLYSRRKNLKRDGLLILYKTKWGINLINYVGRKYPKTLKTLSYLSVAVGYFLMITMIYLLGKIVYLYATIPSLAKAIKVPPLIPLVPYLPQVFKLDFLPPFYFTFWIIIIAVVAISHEFAHGIFASYDNVRIKSTGFGFFPFFLPIFLAAFVELDEKKMAKKPKFSQLTILSAGTFANLLTAILFFGVMAVFFSLAFSPNGVIFDTYPYSVVSVSAISMINGVPMDNPTYEKILGLANDSGFNKIKAGGIDYIAAKDSLERQRDSVDGIILYYDAPAINSNLESVIISVNGNGTNSVDSLKKELSKYDPGEMVVLEVLGGDGEKYGRDIILGENPFNKKASWLGIGFSSQESTTTLGSRIYSWFSFKEQNVYYKSEMEAGLFIYNLLWWLVLISISVALINMLPVGIFDGGRFFYLTLLAITKNENIARVSFAFATYFILAIFFALMFFWVVAFF